MFIEELSNGKYKISERYKDPLSDKWKKVSVTVDNNKKSTIRSAENTLRNKIIKKLSTTCEDCTMQSLAEKYKKAQKLMVTESTARRNSYFADAACEMLGADTLVSNLTAGYVKSCLADSGKDASGINEFITRFKTLMRWGYNNDYVSDISYLSKIQKIKDEKKKEKLSEKYLEKDELVKLLEAMAVDQNRNIAEFMAMTGLRVGECLALNIFDIDIKNRVIHVNKTLILTTGQIQERTKTDAGTRDVYIQEQIVPLCKEIKRIAMLNRMTYGCDLIFQNNGKPVIYNTFNQYLKKKSQETLGRKISTHYLRHTHVSLLAEQGLSLEVISRRVGHEDSAVTRKIYFHVTKNLAEKDKEIIKDIKII